MANVILRPPWALPEREATPETVYWSRREFVKGVGVGAAGLAAGCAPRGGGTGGAEAGAPGGGGAAGVPPDDPLATIPPTPTRDLYPAPRNPGFTLDRPVTDRLVAATYNNFYEFLTDKEAVWRNTGPFVARPWAVDVDGLVERPGVFDVASLEREFGLEERLYRFRCVEAWAMAVPWVGFPLRKLLEKVRPRGDARYVRFVSFHRPDQAVGQRTQTWYPWPYHEGLRLDEALNELAFVATGIYGAPLPKQHGAPIRIVVPWKYGFKGPKSIVRIELVRERPRTFWNALQPDEYGFYSNVNPDVPHPRWSQETEEMIGTGERRPTLLFNGYGEWVADLYDPALLRYRS